MARFHPTAIVSVPLILALIVAVACGGATAPTPRAAAPTAVTQQEQPTAPTAVTQQEQPTAPTAVTQQEQPMPTTEPVMPPALGVVTKAPVATAMPTPETPAALVTSTTPRLVITLGRLGTETNLPCGGSWLNFDKKQFYENLMGIDQFTGQLTDGVSHEWDVSPDGKTWRFFLREGVQFHHGWGELTAKDVKHMFAMVAAEGAKSEDTIPFRKTIKEVEIINDYEVVVHQTKPDLFTVAFFNAGKHGCAVLVSKDQWDAEGEAGYLKTIVGTAPYQFVKRELGASILGERVENHWRHTAEFEELDLHFTEEEATRLATLLARESHIVALPRDLQDTALENGFEKWESILPAVQSGAFMFGQYYVDPDKLNEEIPWVGQHESAKKVRQALNKAINRPELLKELFKGSGKEIKVWAFEESLPGWNPEWEEKWDEMYGYDPKRARELIAEAGYPNGFTLDVRLNHSGSVPENYQMGEAVQNYFRDVGLDVGTFQAERATWSLMGRNKERGTGVRNGVIAFGAGTYRDPQFGIGTYNADHGVVHSYETQYLFDQYEKLTEATSPEERGRLEREIGDAKFNEFAEIPLFWLPGVAIVDPDVVSEYIFPGNRRQIWSHFEFIKAANTK